ncbi:macrolide transporter subunit MacA [uncultured Clostridium sp.]|nr:macrolide transporter subunit MacA [uncultured Clostridium sp.]
MKKKLVVKISVVLLGILIVCTFLSTTIYNLTLPQVEIAQIQSGYVTRSADATGSFTMDNVVQLKARDHWEITEVFVNGGDRVQEGQQLFAIDMTQANLALRELELKVEKAEKTLKQTYGKAEKAEAQLQLDRLQVQLTQMQEAYPTDGIVLAQSGGLLSDFSLQKGDVLEKGQDVLSIYPAGGTLMVRFYLPADQGGSFINGCPVELKFQSLDTQQQLVSDQIINSQVAERRLRSDLNQWEFDVPVENYSGQPMMGQEVAVHVSNPGVMQDFVVPTECVRRGAEENAYFIYVVEQKPGLFKMDTYVREIKVDKLYGNNTQTAISGSGLLMGMLVVRNSSQPLAENMTVGVPAGYTDMLQEAVAQDQAGGE